MNVISPPLKCATESLSHTTHWLRLRAEPNGTARGGERQCPDGFEHTPSRGCTQAKGIFWKGNNQWTERNLHVKLAGVKTSKARPIRQIRKFHSVDQIAGSCSA